MSDDEKKEIAKKFTKLIANTLGIQEERIIISAIFNDIHVLARVELRDAKFVDAFSDKLLMYTKYDEIPVVLEEE